nr:MAG TPA: hypothetical protein [Caudoviricetes sp.]
MHRSINETKVNMHRRLTESQQPIIAASGGAAQYPREIVS